MQASPLRRSLSSLPSLNSSLRDPLLFKENLNLICGEWVLPKSRRLAPSLPVFDPAFGPKCLLGHVPNAQRSEVRHAISFAYSAFQSWKHSTSLERAEVLREWANLHDKHLEDLALIMTREQGKPIDEAKAEVKYSASFFRWFAEESRRIRGDVLVAPERFQRQVVQKEPVGVVAAITPWNFPLAMLARKIAPAIAAGCTVLVKPSELTPLSAFALCELGIRAGLPKGVVQCITGEAQEIADEILENALVRKISFTGSVRVGKRIMAKCADNIKRISLELGGNAPFIVFQDADVRKAVDGLMASKFRNSGQTCVCANRVFVHEEIHDEFVELLAARASALRIGHGTSPGVVQGPLINEAAVEKVEGIVQDAVSRGAKILSGGQRWTGMPGFFFQPTVLTNTTMEMLCAKEEIFGPIAPVFKFSTEEEVVEKANNTNAGLAAYIFSKDLARGWRVAESLECGMVGVNTGMVSSEIAPFGGIKESGIGREGSHYGIDEYLEKKFIYLA